MKSQSDTKRKKTTINVLKTILFFFTAFLLFAYLNHVFSIGNNDFSRQIIKGFYAQEEDTVDVVYIGTSATHRYYIPPLAYKNSGITAYNISVSGLPLFDAPYLIDEAEKTQDPDLYIIELRWLRKEFGQVPPDYVRNISDNLKYSETKLEVARESVDFLNKYWDQVFEYNIIDYVFPITKYHWKFVEGDLDKADLLPYNYTNKTKGFSTTSATLAKTAVSAPEYSSEKTEMSDFAEDALYDTLDRCDALDREVLFVLSPYAIKAEEYETFNTAAEIVEERGYTLINFNDPDIFYDIGIDLETDFYNSRHVNYLGAEKYTAYLTNYISDNYELQDHRGDSRYDSWEDAYIEYRRFIRENT